MSQLDKCLKFEAVREDIKDCILYKITPWNAINFRHLPSCGAVGQSPGNVQGKCMEMFLKLFSVGCWGGGALRPRQLFHNCHSKTLSFKPLKLCDFQFYPKDVLCQTFREFRTMGRSLLFILH